MTPSNLFAFISIRELATYCGTREVSSAIVWGDPGETIRASGVRGCVRDVTGGGDVLKAAQAAGTDCERVFAWEASPAVESYARYRYPAKCAIHYWCKCFNKIHVYMYMLQQYNAD